MPTPAFAAAVVGGLLWFLFAFLALPYLAARVLSALLPRLAGFRVRLAALQVYPLAGAVVLRGLLLASPDAAVEVRHATLTARWWAREAVDRGRGASAATALFAAAFDGVRVRVVNNAAAYDALARAAAAAGETGGAPHPGACAAAAPAPAQALSPDSLLAWVVSRTTVRVASAALYVLDGREDDAGMLTVLVDSLKLRYAALESPVEGRVRQDSGRVVVNKLRVGVVIPGGGEEPARRVGEPLDSVPIFTAAVMTCKLTADVVRGDGGSAGAVGDVESGPEAPSAGAPSPKAVVDATIDGAQFIHDGASFSVAQKLMARLSPDWNHLVPANVDEAVPLSVRISAAPRGGEPLLLYPFLPREASWRLLRALGVASDRWSAESAAHGTDNRTAGPVFPYSACNICASGASAEFVVPSSAMAALDMYFTLDSLDVNFSGVTDAPFLQSAAAKVAYRETVRSFWNEKRVAECDIALESPRILYTVDAMRVFDDISFGFSSFAHAPATVRGFVPYQLSTKIWSRTGFAVRVCTEEMNAWPSLRHALADTPETSYAELRGRHASLSLAGSASLEYAPIQNRTDWRVEMPDVEFYLVFPLAMPDQAAPADFGASDVDGSPAAPQRSGRLVLSDLIRHAVDDATHSSHWFSLGHAWKRSSADAGSEGLHGDDVALANSFCQEIRIAHAEGRLSVSGEVTTFTADVPFGLDVAATRLDAGRVVLDANPHHAPVLLTMVDNLLGAMTHSLSCDERQQAFYRRRRREKDLTESILELAQFDAFVLGFAGGLLGSLGTCGYALRTSFSADFDDVSLRCHVLPGAACSFLNDPQSVTLGRLGSVLVRTDATTFGAVLEARPVDPKRPTIISSALRSGLREPRIRMVGWEWTRCILQDANAAPYTMSTSMSFGRIVGSLTTGSFLQLSKFTSLLRESLASTGVEALDSAWTVLSFSASADCFDVVVLLGADGNVAHLVAPAGMRANMNNLSTLLAMGRSFLTVPDFRCGVYTLTRTTDCEEWDFEERPLVGELFAESSRAAKLAPICLSVTMVELPRQWSPAHARAQRRRLQGVDSFAPRCSYLYSNVTKRSLLLHRASSRDAVASPLALYYSSWWQAAAASWPSVGVGKGVEKMRGQKVSETRFEILLRGILSLTVGPRAVLAMKQCVEFLQSEGEFGRDLGVLGFDERDVASVWAEGSSEWNHRCVYSAPSCPSVTVGSLEVESCALDIDFPLEYIVAPSWEEIGKQKRAEGRQFAGEHECDSLHVAFPSGFTVTCSVFNPSMSDSGVVPKDITSDRSFRVAVPRVVVKSNSGQELLNLKHSEGVYAEQHFSGELKRIVNVREAVLKLRRVRFGSNCSNLDAVTSFGRLSCVYGLLLGSVARRLGKLFAENVARRRKTKTELLKFHPLHRAGIACVAILAFRKFENSSGSLWIASDVDVPEKSPRSDVIVRNREGAVLRNIVFQEVFDRNVVVSNGTYDDGFDDDNDYASWLARLGNVKVSISVDTLNVAILNQVVLQWQAVKLQACNDGALDGCDATISLSLDSLRLAARRDIISELLNATASVASHVVRASSYIPKDVVEHHVAGPTFSYLQPTMNLSSPDSVDPDVNYSDTGKMEGKQTTPLKADALRSVLSRSGGSNFGSSSSALDEREASREGRRHSVHETATRISGSLASGHVPAESTSIPIDNVNVNGGARGSWLARAAQVAESALTSVGVGVYRARSADRTRVRCSSDAELSSPRRQRRGRKLRVSVMVSIDVLDIAYRHSSFDLAGQEVGDPDLRITFAGVCFSGESGSTRNESAVLLSNAVSIKSRNKSNCILSGSMSKFRALMSLAPGPHALQLRSLTLSLLLCDVDISLEATDIRSVLLFQELFANDIKTLSEALVATEAAVWSMVEVFYVEDREVSKTNIEHALLSGVGDVGVSVVADKMVTSLGGFHPGDKSMYIGHEASRVFASAAASEKASAVLTLGCRVQGHSLVTSASHWSSAEVFHFPALDICGVQWSHECALPTQLELVAGPSTNNVSFQSVRNFLFAATGLLAFQNETGVLEQNRSSLPEVAPPELNAVTDASFLDGPILSRAVAAWERTKAVRMDVRFNPLSVGLASGSVMMTFKVGLLAGVVEWNRFLESGVQLHGAIVIPPASILFSRSVPLADSSLCLEDAGLSIDFEGGRLDILKSQLSVLHKFIFKVAVGNIDCVVRPWRFMEDAADWADEQDFIKEVQSMHLGSTRGRGGSSAAREQRDFLESELRRGDSLRSNEESELENTEHRLLEVGFEVASAVLRIPLLPDECASRARLTLGIREIVLKARFGDDMALPSQLNLAKAHVRSFAVLWDESDLFNASQGALIFALRRSPATSGAHFGLLRGTLSVGSWVICPRQDVVVAVLDARNAQRSVSLLRAKSARGFIPDRLARSKSDTSKTILVASERQRVLFECIEVLVLPSPGYIEGVDAGAVGRSDPQFSVSTSPPPIASAGSQSHFSALHLPIPLFSVGFVRDPLFSFDLVDINFLRKMHEKFPDGCLGKVATLFSELFGAVSTRSAPTLLHSGIDEGSFLAQRAALEDSRPSEAVDGAQLEMFGRDLSVLTRFGKSRYTANENLYGKLQSRLSFYAGQGSGVLASMYRPSAAALTLPSMNPFSRKVTVLSAASPIFKLEIHPTLETTSPQTLVLQSVKLLQGFTTGVLPHTVFHVAEVKAELDIMTLLLSRQWIGRNQVESAPNAHVRSSDAVAATAQQAALALASAAPSETKIVVVLGEAYSGDASGATEDVVNGSSRRLLARNRKALLLRLRLAQPEGRVGLVVKRVYVCVGREEKSYRRGVEKKMGADIELAIHHATSRADWEHLSYDCGFQRIVVRADTLKDPKSSLNSTVESAGFAAMLRQFRFNCKRDENDALKLEIDGAALATCIHADRCVSSLESMNVDAYISSSTVKTMNRLRQLQSRLIRGLKPQVERLLLAEFLRKGSRKSIDNGDVLRAQETERLPAENPASTPGSADRMTPSIPSFGAMRAQRLDFVKSHITVAGDQLVLTMHGFSFDANQPQAKLIFTSYDLDYNQGLHSEHEVESIDSSTPGGDRLQGANVERVLALEYTLLDVQYSDQRQQLVTVMSLPNPHLRLSVTELPNVALVHFTTRFDSAVVTSPSVSHYDYLRQLLSLYRTATTSSFARTISALEFGHRAATRSVESDSHADGGELSLEVSTGDRERWSGREVVFKSLEFAPTLSALGDLTPDVASVLGWLGVGGIEALPSGLYDILVVPLSNFSLAVVDLSKV